MPYPNLHQISHTFIIPINLHLLHFFGCLLLSKLELSGE